MSVRSRIPVVVVMLAGALAVAGIAGATMLRAHGRNSATMTLAGDADHSEVLGGETILVAGIPATVSGMRTASETTIAIAAPGLRMLTPPTLRVGGKTLEPTSFAIEPDGMTATFAATDFGSPVEARLGSVAADNTSEMTSFGLYLDAVLKRSNGGKPVEVRAEDVFLGDAERVVSVERGDRNDGRKSAIVVVEGNWHPDFERPVILDGSGEYLRFASAVVGYGKDDGGRVLAGTTEIEFIVGSKDLRTITLLLGPQAMVDPSTYKVELRPE